MNHLLALAVIGGLIYIIYKSSNPQPVIAGPAPDLTVGLTLGGNTYPGMLGATYTPVPGSSALVMRVY